MPGKRYTDEQRATAVEMLDSCGGKYAAAETGIPEGTIRSWKHRSPEKTWARDTERAAQARRAEDSWTVRRADLATQAAHAIALAVAQQVTDLEAGRLTPDQRTRMIGALRPLVGSDPEPASVDVETARAKAYALLDQLTAGMEDPPADPFAP